MSKDTRSIIESFDDQTKSYKIAFMKRIEEQIKELAKKNSTLETNINKAANNLKYLQEEKLEIDEQLIKLIADNKKLKANLETFKQNESAFKDLPIEDKKLRGKKTSV